VPKEEKPAAGKTINIVKGELEAALTERRGELELKAALRKNQLISLCRDVVDRWANFIRVNPVTEEASSEAFGRLGSLRPMAPKPKDEYHCFDALNTPADHPARDTQDTFYLADSGNAQAGSQTPDVAAHAYLLGPNSRDGKAATSRPDHRARRVYRRDNADATHNPTFQQVEGLYVDRNVPSRLKGHCGICLQGADGTRNKNSFPSALFQHTEPSFEIDFSSP